MWIDALLCCPEECDEWNPGNGWTHDQWMILAFVCERGLCNNFDLCREGFERALGATMVFPWGVDNIGCSNAEIQDHFRSSWLKYSGAFMCID